MLASYTFAASSGQIYPNADTIVVDEAPNTIYGATADITVQNMAFPPIGKNRIAFLYFNMENITYLDANFHFFNRITTIINPNATLNMYWCNNSFPEMDVKFSNYEDYFYNCEGSPFYSVNASRFSTSDYNTTNITAKLNANDKTFTIKIAMEPYNGTNADSYIAFQSKETANVNERPYINWSTEAVFLNLGIYNELNHTQILNNTIFTTEIFSSSDNLSYINNSVNGWVNLTNMPPSDYEIRFYHNDFKIRSIMNSFLPAEHYEMNLFAINDSEADSLDVIVRDFTLVGLKNATVILQRWYSDLGTGLNMAEGVTNSQGKFRFYVDRGDAYYRLIVNYGGVAIFITDWELINDDTFRITTDTLQLYNAWSVLDGSLNFYNSSIPYYYELVYANKGTDVATVCLDVTEMDNVSGTPLNYNTTCLSSTSGTISTTINETRSYIGTAYVTYTNGAEQNLDSIPYTVLSSFEEDLREEGLFISLMIVICVTMGALYVSGGNPIAAIAGFNVALLFVKFVGLYTLSIWALGIIIPGSFVIMYYLNKKT